MQAINHLYIYFFLAFVPSTIQATSTLDKIDECLKYVEEYRQSKAIFYDCISQDIERKIFPYLPCRDRSRMRRISVACNCMIELVDHQNFLIKINNGQVDALDDKIVIELRKGDFCSTMSFFFNEYHRLCYKINIIIPWLRILTRAFPNHLFEYFEQRYENLTDSIIYCQRYDKAFVLAFYKTKGLSKNEFPRLSSDMFRQFKYLSCWDLSFALKCIKNYLDRDMADFINERVPNFPRGTINFDQLKEYLAIAYKAGYLLLFGQTMIEDDYCFRRIAKVCLKNKQQGKNLLGEICYVAFYHNPKKESMQAYKDINKHIKDRKRFYKHRKDDIDAYATFKETDEVLSQLPKYKSLSLLTAVVAGLYKK